MGMKVPMAPVRYSDFAVTTPAAECFYKRFIFIGLRLPKFEQL